MITGRVAMMNVAVADSRWRSFPLRGPLPFSGANAACGYLPLQLALRPFVIGILLVLFGTGMDGQVRAGLGLYQPIGFEGLNLDINWIIAFFRSI